MEARTPHRAPLRLVLAAVALAAVPLGATATAVVLPELCWKVVLVGLCTAALSVVAVRAALLRASCGSVAAVLCLIFAVLAAVANSPLSFTTVCLSTARAEALLFVPLGLVFATIFGMIFAVPIGILLGALYAALVGAAFELCRSPAQEAPDRVLRVCGAWLSLTGLLCLGADRILLGQGQLGEGPVTVLFVAAAACAVIGLAAALTAQESLRARRRWLERVRAGQVPGWVVVPRSEISDWVVRGLRPVLLGPGRSGAVLARCSAGLRMSGGAYRARRWIEPIALLD